MSRRVEKKQGEGSAGRRLPACPDDEELKQLSIIGTAQRATFLIRLSSNDEMTLQSPITQRKTTQGTLTGALYTGFEKWQKEESSAYWLGFAEDGLNGKRPNSHAKARKRR
ncbi:MAG: hypothetical protein ABI882_10320 [Acidobacteriota bacterium]